MADGNRFEIELIDLLEREPFVPFTIVWRSGDRYEVATPAPARASAESTSSSSICRIDVGLTQESIVGMNAGRRLRRR